MGRLFAYPDLNTASYLLHLYMFFKLYVITKNCFTYFESVVAHWYYILYDFHFTHWFLLILRVSVKASTFQAATTVIALSRILQQNFNTLSRILQQNFNTLPQILQQNRIFAEVKHKAHEDVWQTVYQLFNTLERVSRPPTNGGSRSKTGRQDNNN